MGYNILAVLILAIGSFVLFSKEVIKVSLLSFIITFILFLVLLANEYYLLGLAFLIMDVLFKFKFFIFLNNKELIEKSPSFKKQQVMKKFLVSMLVAISVGVMRVIYEGKYHGLISEKNNELEMLTFGTIVSIFLISGYVVKSRKWK